MVVRRSHSAPTDPPPQDPPPVYNRREGDPGRPGTARLRDKLLAALIALLVPAGGSAGWSIMKSWEVTRESTALLASLHARQSESERRLAESREAVLDLQRQIIELRAMAQRQTDINASAVSRLNASIARVEGVLSTLTRMNLARD